MVRSVSDPAVPADELGHDRTGAARHDVAGEMRLALEVITFRRGPFWNFSYLLACTATGEAAAIDPAWDVDGILAAAGQRALKITSVLLTHGHSDHANGVAALVAATGAPVFAHEAEATSLAQHHDGEFEALTESDTLRIGQFEADMLWTPGHSVGSSCFVVDGRLFSGDTVAVGGVGRPEAAGVEALWESARRLAGLPRATLVLPGHDEGATATSTIGAELERGGAFGAATFAAFVLELERSTGRSHSS